MSDPALAIVKPTESPLARLELACRLLAEARSLDEVKVVVDLAEAARVYARQARLGLEAQNDAAELRLRAERRAGELLATMEKHAGGRPTAQPPPSQSPPAKSAAVDEKPLTGCQGFFSKPTPTTAPGRAAHHLSPIQPVAAACGPARADLRNAYPHNAGTTQGAHDGCHAQIGASAPWSPFISSARSDPRSARYRRSLRCRRCGRPALARWMCRPARRLTSVCT